jgi:hypothetical protein
LRIAVEVEADRHDAVRAAGVVGRLRHAEPIVGLQAALLRAGHAPQKIDLAVLERQDLGAGVGDDAHHDLVEVRQAALEVARVASQPDLRALAIGDELERARADGARVGRIRLRIAGLIHVPGDDGRLGGVELLQQRRVGLFEANDDGAIVGRVDAGQHRYPSTPSCGRGT